MNLKNIDKSFFINLDHRKDRLEHINKNLPFSAQRYPAIDAKNLELNDEIKKMFGKNLQKFTKAEIACSLSHYRLWKRLTLDKDADNYLILEDDAVFKEGFTNFWNQVFSKHIPKNYNLIYLGGCQPWNKPHYHKVLEKYNDYFFNIKKNDFFTKNDHFWHMNASSYILSKQAASLLCQYVAQQGINQALDNFMQNFFNQNKIFSSPYSIYHLNPLMSYQLHEENDNPEIDKKSDIRNDKEKFDTNQKITDIKYWKYSKGYGNFGDELNVPVGKFLFGNGIEFNKEYADRSIRLIGSKLQEINSSDIICGVGLHHYSQNIKHVNNEYRCVRGPLSLKWLKCSGVETKDTFMGDPALLLPMFYEPKNIKALNNKTGVIPHISNISYFEDQVCNNESLHLINPTDRWESVIDQIFSCNEIISSSLHGLICSDAYSKPNVWIKIKGQSIPPCGPQTDYGQFKYWDYLLSQGRPICFIESVFEKIENKLYKHGNTIDLNQLKKSITSEKTHAL